MEIRDAVLLACLLVYIGTCVPEGCTCMNWTTICNLNYIFQIKMYFFYFIEIKSGLLNG